MRLLCLLVLSSALVACQRTVEVSGLYVASARGGVLFLCDQPNPMWQVSDSTLAAAYRLKAAQPGQPLFVRLRGVKLDSAGIYGNAGYGKNHLLVRQVLAMRPRANGECPGITDTRLALP
jgi:hypothetical protein